MSCTMPGPVAWRRRLYVASSDKPSRASSKSFHLRPLGLFLSSFVVHSYLHINGFIHRDIKAANLLIDDDGTVLLGDLGVAAPLADEDHTHIHDKASRAVIFDPDVDSPQRHASVGKRRSFVGTVGPPPHHKTLIIPNPISHVGWRPNSFQASTMTLAPISGPSASQRSSWHRGGLPDHGNHLVQSFLRCKLSCLSLSRPLPLATIRGKSFHFYKTCSDRPSHGSVEAAPPTLDREGGVHKYSRTFKEIVDRCLVKDPSLRYTPFRSPRVFIVLNNVSHRPTAAQLLQTPFFKNTKKPSYLVGTILRMLPLPKSHPLR
jgi:serine/threonine-protein kinase OSR1/STK39